MSQFTMHKQVQWRKLKSLFYRLPGSSNLYPNAATIYVNIILYYFVIFTSYLLTTRNNLLLPYNLICSQHKLEWIWRVSVHNELWFSNKQRADHSTKATREETQQKIQDQKEGRLLCLYLGSLSCVLFIFVTVWLLRQVFEQIGQPNKCNVVWCVDIACWELSPSYGNAFLFPLRRVAFMIVMVTTYFISLMDSLKRYEIE